MYRLRDSIRLGLLIGASLGIVTEAAIAVGQGSPGLMQLMLRYAHGLVTTVPLG